MADSILNNISVTVLDIAHGSLSVSPISWALEDYKLDGLPVYDLKFSLIYTSISVSLGSNATMRLKNKHLDLQSPILFVDQATAGLNTRSILEFSGTSGPISGGTLVVLTLR